MALTLIEKKLQVRYHADGTKSYIPLVKYVSTNQTGGLFGIVRIITERQQRISGVKFKLSKTDFFAFKERCQAIVVLEECMEDYEDKIKQEKKKEVIDTKYEVIPL